MTVQVKGQLTIYPSITGTTSFTVTFSVPCVSSFGTTSVSVTKYLGLAASSETIQLPSIGPSGCSPTPTFTWTVLESGITSTQVTPDSSTNPTVFNFATYTGLTNVGAHTYSIQATSSTGQVITYSLVVTVIDLCATTVSSFTSIAN